MASMCSPSPAPDSPLAWDVFLSYRGPDTGPTFTGHLFAALHRHGIQAYKDDYKLRLGEVISDALRDAIKTSKIYIVVFSKGYATSPWCLDELVDIVGFKKTEGRLIIPVFHYIDPSIVRHVSEGFKYALEVHEEGHYKNQMQKVDNWRAALKEAANVSGEHVCEKNRVEADVIEKIVAEILPRINPKGFHEKTVGLEFRIESIASMLSSEHPAGVTKIGIYGMGGVGKTTLAKAVFTKIYLDFTGSCFLADITANSSTTNGMKSLQQQLLNDVLLRQNEKDVNDVVQGENLIKSKLSNKKILVVMDDLNHSYQHKSLGVESFAPGSVVIVTTRHEEILADFGVKTEYRHMVNELGPIESLVLFNQHAFGFGSKPDNTLIELSKNILSYANGLPLALKVFGSFLRTKYTVEEWREFIEKLKRTPNKQIQDRLLISFNAIDDDPQVKKMFLDVACFFIGWPEKRVFEILETYYSNVNVKINNLKGRCLLTINDRNVLHMHDLLRDMGREVARNDSPDEPEKHSRLWISEDIHSVLSEKEEETKAIEGIFYNDVKEASREVSLTTETFKNMKRLRFLHLRGFKNLAGSFRQTFKDVRWLYWDWCPLECFPSEFKPLNLGILELRHSIMTTLEPNMAFHKLKILNMAESIHLATTPDFTRLPCLVTLNLSGCEGLKELHTSIGNLARLVSLDLNYCLKLASLPGTIGDLKALKFLDVSECKSLVELPEELGNIGSLEKLCISGLRVEKLPHSIGLLYNLVVLESESNINLRTLPDNICKLSSLEVLNVNFCGDLEALPKELGNITSLKVLEMRSTHVSDLPDSIGHLSNLVKLILCSCYYLKTLPDTICSLWSLEILKINCCTNLGKLPGQMHKITSLRDLDSSCNTILKVESSQIPSSLKRLDFYGNGFTALPYDISRLSNIVYLNVAHCTNLLFIEELPPNLIELKASFCTSMLRFQIQANMKHLEILELQDCGNLKAIQGLEQLTSIKRFDFAWCTNLLSVELPPNLKLISAQHCTSLARLPNLSDLKHLEKIDLTECTSLTEIQGMEELTSLRILDLHRCIRLLSIGELPPNLERMTANQCISMQSLPNLSKLKHLEMLDLTHCSGLTEIQGLEELSSIRELRLAGCRLPLLQHTFTKRFFQTISGFENVIKIYLTWRMILPSWISQLSNSASRRVSLDLTSSTSHNFLGTIICFKEAIWIHSTEATYSIKNITSGFIWSGRIDDDHRGGYVIIVPASVFSVKNDDRRIEFTAAGRDFLAIHLLYNDTVTGLPSTKC